MKINWSTSLDLVLADKHDQIDRGISLELFQSEYGEDKTQEDLENITGDMVARVYKKFYWDECICDDLPGGVDYMIFDAAVYFGSYNALLCLEAITRVNIKQVSQPMVIFASKKFYTELVMYKIYDRNLKSLFYGDRFSKEGYIRFSRVLQSALEMRY